MRLSRQAEVTLPSPTVGRTVDAEAPSPAGECAAAFLYRDNVGLITRIARGVGRRARLDGEAVEDFVSDVHVRLLEQDFAVLRKFQGRSSLATYLNKVFTRMALDFRGRRWGRWRPSDTAMQLGPAAVQLEQLILRDGHSFEEACALIGERHHGAVSRADLEHLAGRLPWHPVRRTTDLEAVDVSGAGVPAAAELDGPARAERARLQRALRFAVASLPSGDRELLRLRYGGGQSLAQVSRVLGLEQRPLYRRVERLHRQLRDAILAGGVSMETAVCAIRH
jgi:RNA polymerase sigma factor (sigma-70 family)